MGFFDFFRSKPLVDNRAKLSAVQDEIDRLDREYAVIKQVIALDRAGKPVSPYLRAEAKRIRNSLGIE